MLTTEDIACLVEVDIKSNNIFPVNKYTGKFSIFRLNIFENTIVIIIITNNGFNTLHKYPRKLLRYFSLMSRLTS
ncbi:hypothetical protein F220043C3_04750 [Enterocloster asparagiformis]